MAHEHVHRRHQRAAKPNEKRDMSTVYEIVYTTASASFTGEIGGYTTLGVPGDDSADQTTSSSLHKTTPSAAAVATSPTLAKPASNSKQTTLMTLPSAISSPSTTIASSLAIVAASGGISSSTTANVASAASFASSSASSASAAADSGTTSAGMSTAGKAGLAIGILLLLGAVLSLVLFCFKKRRDAAKHERVEDEKHEFANIDRHMSTRTTATTATAPRLSLRPVTQFLPNLTVKRASRGNALLTVTEDGKQWDMDHATTAQSQANNEENPFGNHAETVAHPSQNPFDNHAEVVSPTSPTSPTSPIDATNANGPEVVQELSANGEIIAGTSVSGAVAAAAPSLKRKESKRENAPSPIDFTRAGPFMGPPSPAGTEFSMSSEPGNNPVQTGTGIAIAAAGGPANSAVHRVQLDFKPSMDDELELRAGQLIRLLHEYDDGWALCIRLDRSRQGVVPRTCLSTRPVKPRPQQNGPRGGSPQMRGSPMTAQGAPRPMTPNGTTPTGPLPLTPVNRSRSPSVAQSQGRPNSPPGPSPMNPVYIEGPGSPPQFPPTPVGRKPVPGQAL